MKNPDTYEIITPSLVGVEKNSLPLGKLSGRHAFLTRLAELGYHLEKAEAKGAFQRFKQLADMKKHYRRGSSRSCAESRSRKIS